MDKVDDRIFDRSRYSINMIRDLDIMSVYFIDIVYNYLYDEAKKLKIDGKVVSVTEGYKHALDAFINALCKNPKLYRKALSGIHEKFLEFNAQSMTFPQCMNRITKHFIPEDYYQSLSDGEKMRILNLVISQSIKELVMKIVKSHIVKIIDYHSERSNISLLKEELIDLFIYERMGVYTRFLSKKTSTNKTSGLSNAMIERMQQEIKRLISEKIELEKKNKQLVSLLTTRINQVKSMNQQKAALASELGELRMKYASINGELQLLKSSPASSLAQSAIPDNIASYPTSPPASPPTSPHKERLDEPVTETPPPSPIRESLEQQIKVPEKQPPKQDSQAPVQIDLGDEISLDGFL